MTRVLEILALGVGAAMLQGAVAGYLPPWWIPDLAFLVVVGVACAWRSAAGGLVLALVLGYAADLLSGSLLGQHALLRVLAFGVTRFAVRRGMRTGASEAAFVFVLTIANVLALSGLTSLFAAAGGVGTLTASHVLVHALVNALAAPVVVRGVRRIGDAGLEEEAGRRVLPLQPRRWGA